MEAYETDDTYTKVEITQFAKFLDDKIGTDYEINESASGEEDEFYIVVVDLLPKEVNMIRNYELKLKEIL